MRASPIRRKGAASFEELKPACQILILHEDFPAYSQAIEVCRRVMERFANELDFNVKCWNFIELADPNSARHAAKTAGGADIILLSTLKTQLPIEVDRWLDFYFTARFRGDGVFALVLNAAENQPVRLEKLALRLEQLASRLDMDFITLRPGDAAPAIDFAPSAAPPQPVPKHS